MLAATPSSARVLAGAAPANALDATMTPVPAPAPAMPTPVTPVAPILLQPPPGKPLLSSSFGGGADIRGVPIRAFVGAFVALGMVGLFFYASHVRSRAQEEELGAPEPKQLMPTPTSNLPPCRLCTADVTVNGPLPKDEISRTVDLAIPTLAAQCLAKDPRNRSRSRKAGMAVVTFTVREGKAVNRRNTAGDGECFARGLGDVPFKAEDVGTDVKYTFRYDSSAD